MPTAATTNNDDERECEAEANATRSGGDGGSGCKRALDRHQLPNARRHTRRRVRGAASGVTIVIRLQTKVKRPKTQAKDERRSDARL